MHHPSHARVPPPLQHTLASWARVNHEAHLKKLALAVESFGAQSERAGAEASEAHGMAVYVQSRIHALSSAVAELPFVFQESVSDLIESHEAMRAELQAMRAQQREERASSRQAIAELRGLIEQSAGARHSAVVARLKALELSAAEAGGSQHGRHSTSPPPGAHDGARDSRLRSVHDRAAEAEAARLTPAVRALERRAAEMDEAARLLTAEAKQSRAVVDQLSARTDALAAQVGGEADKERQAALAEALRSEAGERDSARAAAAEADRAAAARRAATVDDQLRLISDVVEAVAVEARRTRGRVEEETAEREQAVAGARQATEEIMEGLHAAQEEMRRELVALARRVEQLRRD